MAAYATSDYASLLRQPTRATLFITSDAHGQATPLPPCHDTPRYAPRLTLRHDAIID